MNIIAVSDLVKGFITLNLILFPLTVLITFYIAVMGAGHPDKSGFLSSLGITAAFIYGMPLGVLVWLTGLGKVFDFMLRLVPMTTPAVSWLGIFLSAVLFVVSGNIFIDNLYQFRQGNYAISFFALLITLLYAVIVYFSAKINISWIYHLFVAGSDG
jgi:hypothetical protein